MQRWGVAPHSLFNGSGETPPQAEQRGRGERAYLQPATEESIPPVAMVTEPSAGKASERGGRGGMEGSRRDVLYRKRGVGGRERERSGGVLTPAIIWIIPPPVCRGKPPSSLPAVSPPPPSFLLQSALTAATQLLNVAGEDAPPGRRKNTSERQSAL